MNHFEVDEIRKLSCWILNVSFKLNLLCFSLLCSFFPNLFLCFSSMRCGYYIYKYLLILTKLFRYRFLLVVQFKQAQCPQTVDFLKFPFYLEIILCLQVPVRTVSSCNRSTSEERF